MIDLIIPPEIDYLKTLTPKMTIYLSEGLTLAWLASKSKDNIVEIGSREGKSACFMAAGSKLGHKVKIYCIDPWELWERCLVYHPPDVRERFHKQTEPYRDIISPIQGFSLEVVKTWDKPIGLLFIDGCHHLAYEDYLAWSQFVIVGGYIAFHNWDWLCVKQGIDKITNVDKWHIVNRLKWGRKI